MAALNGEDHSVPVMGRGGDILRRGHLRHRPHVLPSGASGVASSAVLSSDRRNDVLDILVRQKWGLCEDGRGLAAQPRRQVSEAE